MCSRLGRTEEGHDRRRASRANRDDVEEALDYGRLKGGGFAWGFVSQGFSSATNLGLALIGARWLGSSGLGVVAVGFSTYLMALGFERALLTEPLITRSSDLPSSQRARVTEEAFALVLLGSLAAAAGTAVAGVFAGGGVGRGLLIVAPWLPALLIQDFWRTVLFRDGRPRAAATNDAAWLVTMAAAIPLAWKLDSDWSTIGCWALGAVAGTLLGFAQTRCAPRRLRAAIEWWRSDLWPLARWLGSNSIVYWIGSYGTVLILVGFVGTSGLGGYRAVSTIFAPLTLVSAAASLPGLPAISRSLASSRHAAVALSARLGLLSLAITTAYVGALSLGSGSIVPRIFGHSFEQFTYLIWPIGVGQLVSAVAVGFTLLLIAEGRGSAYLVCTGVGSAVSVTLVYVFGDLYGLNGAAWGISCSAILGTIVTILLATRSPKRL